ncbi:hypothetical protein BpHYR1_016132 [Brachionus plicatilis]|uniref:Uncharacterized protein n=1 Tax=Brachionus plicatilis TaxID=10195 RepID=A0A3M7QRF4_BRAPC|nr:hypothetical protein BpHYR1_016132 [Brachionus plicatilis]
MFTVEASHSVSQIYYFLGFADLLQSFAESFRSYNVLVLKLESRPQIVTSSVPIYLQSFGHVDYVMNR